MKTIARLFKALADETRLRILVLLTRGELCVCDLMAVLELPQSTVSRHLAFLRNAGWVDDRRQGVWMYYRLRREGQAFSQDLLALLEKHLVTDAVGKEDLNRLEIYLMKKEGPRCR